MLAPVTDKGVIAAAASVAAAISACIRNQAACFPPPEQRTRSLAFAWNVAGDYFNVIKTRQMKDARPGRTRRGAAAVYDPRTATTNMAPNRPATRNG